MLVFTRKRDEAIIIGDGIEVRVLRAGREGVKIGVTAPPSVSVHRREIYDLIRAENEGAVRRSDDIRQLISRLTGPPASSGE
jgi:carbon storage regulator